MENILNIVYREPELEDAEKIVDFYNYVGGGNDFLEKKYQAKGIGTEMIRNKDSVLF